MVDRVDVSLTYSEGRFTWTGAEDVSHVLIESSNIESFTIEVSTDGTNFTETDFHGDTTITRPTNDTFLVPLADSHASLAGLQGIEFIDSDLFDTETANIQVSLYNVIWAPSRQFTAEGYTPQRRVKESVFEKLDGGTSVSHYGCLLYTSPSPRDRTRSRMPSSA